MVIQTGSVAMGSSHYLSRKNLQAVGYGSWGKTVNSVGSTAATTPTATDGGQQADTKEKELEKNGNMPWDMGMHRYVDIALSVLQNAIVEGVLQRVVACFKVGVVPAGLVEQGLQGLGLCLSLLVCCLQGCIVLAHLAVEDFQFAVFLLAYAAAEAAREQG